MAQVLCPLPFLRLFLPPLSPFPAAPIIIASVLRYHAPCPLPTHRFVAIPHTTCFPRALSHLSPPPLSHHLTASAGGGVPSPAAVPHTHRARRRPGGLEHPRQVAGKQAPGIDNHNHNPTQLTIYLTTARFHPSLTLHRICATTTTTLILPPPLQRPRPSKTSTTYAATCLTPPPPPPPPRGAGSAATQTRPLRRSSPKSRTPSRRCWSRASASRTPRGRRRARLCCGSTARRLTACN